MLTPKQKELLDYIEEYLNLHGYAPTFIEMMNATGLASKSGVYRILDALEERGFIRRLRSRRRAIEVIDRQLLAASSDGALLLECLRRGLIKTAH